MSFGPEHEGSEVTTTDRIVVGIDRSPEAVAALRWAYEEARVRGAVLEVVHAWRLPFAGDPAGLAAEPRSFLGAATHLLSSVVDGELSDHPGVEVVQTLVNGDPAAALIAKGEGADLVVVGSRGHGGFTGLLLGSVSHKVADHAPCPVAIVRPPAAA
ncbi:MAG TPA: universal stress protein [Acidimicrobiales bacterium]|nr:universal stress protein [Acidimicrobiales bacterium]